MSYRPCILIPTYNNPNTIVSVVQRARSHLRDVLVVDDGSGTPARDIVAALQQDGLARVRRRKANGGIRFWREAEEASSLWNGGS